MDDVKRRVTQFLFALGLLLTLAVCVAWMRGHWASEMVRVVYVSISGDRRIEYFAWAACGPNQIWFAWDRGQRSEAAALQFGRETGQYRPAGLHWEPQTGPPYNVRYDTPFAFREGEAWAPVWFLAGICALLASAAFFRLRIHARLRRRAASGQCVACGYDLRGAAHDRCPECGAGVEPPVARA